MVTDVSVLNASPQPTNSVPSVSLSELDGMLCAVSDAPADVDLGPLFFGSELLGFDVKPQGLAIGCVAQAIREDGRPLYRQVGIQVPRRAAKTTSTTELALGRMAKVPGYKIISTAQTGDIARRMWRDMVQFLDAHYAMTPEDERPYRARIANGTEVLTWENGSTWRPVTPSPLSYRSQAADLLIFEEAGHIPPELAADLRAGAFPTMDTRPAGQVWIIGTPGKQRAGMLWDALVAGRAGKPGFGVVDFTIGDDVSIVHEDGSLNVDLLARVHPGIPSGLTTVEILLERFETMSVHDFAAEYAGQWPPDAHTSAIDMDAWRADEVPVTALPERFGLAFDVANDASSAALCAAWRDEDGRAYLAVVDHRTGVSWLAKKAHAVARKHRVPIRYDGVGANLAPAREIERLRGVATESGGMRDAMAAAQVLVSTLTDGNLRPFGQGSLRASAEGATWRLQEGGRLFGRKGSVGDVTPLVAASLALWQFDQLPARQVQRIITSRRK